MNANHDRIRATYKERRLSMNRGLKKRNNRAIIIGASISVMLLIAIIGSIIYKNEMAKNSLEDSKEETPIIETPVQKEVVSEEKPEVEQPLPPVETPKENVIPAEPEKPVDQPKEKEPQVTPEQPEKAKPATSSGYIEGQKVPAEPTYINGILIANKKYPLPPTYNKGEDPKAKAAFDKMAAAAREQGLELVAFSGFRSYDYQKTLYTNYVKRDGQEQADRYSARPGHSEHQTGLAFDIGEKGKEDLWLTSAFGETKAGKWLVEHAHEYGFILRYPKGKEAITGFMYESWHFRYLGVETATKVKQSGVTLEEYLGIQ